jgi:hypothetical protein
MALITESEVRAAARRFAAGRSKTAKMALKEAVVARSAETSFDVFMSHSRADAEVVLGAKLLIEATGKKVYVDWIDDAELDRSKVTPGTANTLRKRMRQSTSLFYVHSSGSSTSRWMPWELGYFDALNGNVAILPIVQTPGQDTFKGEEYLGLYPYVDLQGLSTSAAGDVVIRRSTFTGSPFRSWVTSAEKLRPL